MAKLKSRYRSIPCGWVFLQPQTNRKFKEHGFTELVQAVINHRKANPQHKLPTDKYTVEVELDSYLANVCLSNPKWTRFATTGEPQPIIQSFSPKAWSPQQLLARAGSAVGVAKTHIRNTVAGIGLYVEWFGKGGEPVSKEEAARRAALCTQCPKQVDGDFVQRWNRATGYEIMTVLSILKDLDLSTPHDDNLKICDACDCPMKAKVWSPLDIIRKHLRPEAEAKLWDKCWIPEPKPEPAPAPKPEPKPESRFFKTPSFKARKPAQPVVIDADSDSDFKE